MGKAPDSILKQNLALADPNKELVFRSAIEVQTEYKGKDALYMKVLFSDGVKITQFNPQDVIRKKSELAVRWGSLCEALGLDFNDIPYCPDFETFVETFINFTFPARGRMVYAKLTVDENGWLQLGTGTCFSKNPDMEYSDEDREHLKLDDMDIKMKGDLPNY
jgi:hypothetical protein